MRLLLVEDDPQVGRSTQLGLIQAGYAVDWVRSAELAFTSVKMHSYESILLDLGLPHEDGISFLIRLRRSGYHGTVLIVTARDRLVDKVKGLDMGADDFIVKPFDLDELTARIRSANRRVAGRLQEKISHRNIELDLPSRLVKLDGQVVIVTSREFNILHLLFERIGQILTRDQLEEALYSWGDEIESNTIQVHIHHLRKKLGRNLIRTVRSIGYVVDNEDPQSFIYEQK
ncbi:response regulator [Undibacterium sp. Ji22W]|uniref:response regulator n=1 Tax=Undibacterium sp. Ji22W TaxID=3413038 RepID=UPI003BF2CADC